ncbi:superoxide dismutase family protein [Chryseobacterium sp. GP-SGM7]|uniref:superoxide dismutase family protein n=1 Tax=Chryseobacterium sp. GP-SGM7 TaxID=3411323 RepID=UPI003B959CA3
MKPTKLLLAAGIALFSVSCSTSKTYNVIAKSGTKTEGTAKFAQNGNNVILNLEVSNLTPGIHAVHIHEKGDCSAPDASSAGGHWNPSKSDHGKWGNAHFHMGDIGNLVADKDGKAKLTFKTDKWCLDCPEEAKNIMGKGLIIHADKDDYQTQPTGNAGGRVGCIEIK